MTAQIRPNRMEVSDRFPMLGFSVRVDEPNVEAEVVLANDTALFGPEGKPRRNASNFYTSRENGTLMVPRGDGVFVVAPEVLARFIGSDKLYFGLATGHTGNGGLTVDALPREGSPYVSLRGFTGRTLRRNFRSSRQAVPPKLEWTGDAPRPGSESAAPANGSAPTNGSAPARKNGSNGVDQAALSARQGRSGEYDDGFGPMPSIPARESSYRGAAGRRGPAGMGIMLSGGTTASDALDWITRKIEQGVAAAGSDVSPPSLYRLGGNSGTFTSAWEAVFGITSFLAPTNAFLAALPSLARNTGVTLSIGPALDTPLFGGGVGVVFAPDGQVALFGTGEISVDFDGLSEFVSSLKVALQAKMKLGYNRGGINGFASLAKVASVNVGEELVVGAELWLNGSGSGIGGAVSIGVGLALQLAAERQRVATRSAPARMGMMLSGGTTASDALDWITRKIEQGVAAAGSDVSPPSLYRLGGNSGTFTSAWEAVFGITSFLAPTNAFLAALPSLARNTGVTLSIGPALDTPLFGGGVGVVFAPDGQVALFGTGEISVDFDGLSEFVSSLKVALQAKMKLGYNRGGINGFASLAKVASVNVGEELVVGAELWLNGSGSGIGGAVSIGVGLALQLAANGRTAPAPRTRRGPAGMGIMLSGGTTASDALDWITRKIEQGVAAAGSDVSPPSLYRLGGNSGTFTSAWEAVFGITSFLAPTNAFLAALPSLARNTGVTLSIGPALDTPLFGGGVGVVFAPDGQVALFGTGEISVDFDGLSEFVSSLKVALQAKMKLGYNRGGINGFASLAKVASVNVGEELVVGAELWLNGSGSGIGGAVSIGVGLALQLAEPENAFVRPVLPNDQRARATRIGGAFAGRVWEALDLGLEPRLLDPLLDTLDPRPTAQPMGVRRGAGRPMARAQSVTRSINWDDVELIPQPTNQTCWAAAAAMIIGWRDQVSLTPETIASICSRSTIKGLSPYDRVTFAGEIGLETEPPQSYSVEGFYNLLTNCGPLWVSKIMGGGAGASGHAIVVTGMYTDGSQDYVRIADPWDRVVGSPGSPGSYANTHSTGSRYIMRYEDFHSEYELRIVGNPPTPQILHSGGTAGRIPNTGTSAAPEGYAMAAAPPRRARAGSRPTTRSRQMDAGAIATIAGTAITLLAGNTGDITWNVPQWAGLKHPNDTAPVTQGTYQDSVIMLDQWPRIGGTFGVDDIYAWFRIRWQYNGTSLGRVYVEPRGNDDALGWGLTVTGTIEDDSRLYGRSPAATIAGPAQVPALHVVMNYVFDETIADSHIASRRITLYADGTHEIDSEWVQHARPFPAEPRDVARAS